MDVRKVLDGKEMRMKIARMTRGRLLAVLALLPVALGITLAGCGGEDGAPAPTAEPTATASAPESPTPAPTATPTAPAVRGTPGCGQPLAAGLRAGETTSRTLQSAGRTRTYLVHVPKGYDPARPIPLVLNFHGLGSNGAQQHVYGGWVPLADREGFVVASPNGVDNSWLLAAGLDDIQFVRDLVAALGGELCLDPARVFASGMSNGGFMSTTLACRASDIIAAIAPVAGQSAPGAACSEEPVPVVSFHGTADGVVPYEAGTVTAGAVTGTPFEGVPSIVGKWAAHNGCSGEPSESRVAADVVKVEYAGCSAPVVHYRVEGGGHTWPGAPAVPRLGTTTTSINAAEVAWAFFVAVTGGNQP